MNLLRKTLIALAAAPLIASSAIAGSYPDRPVNLVVPFAAGGPTDTIARIVASSFEAQSGQPFVVENRGGAGSTIGTAHVATSNPDGYKLLWGSSSAMVIAPHLYTTLQYDPLTSFERIGMVAATPYVLLVNADSPYKTYDELVQAAKKDKDGLTYSSPGAGTSLHLTIELMASESGFSALHIPYRGGAPAMTALLAKDVDFLVDVPSAALPQVAAGKARALAVTSPERLPQLPDVPTLREEGLAGFQSQAWFALFAPKGTPQEALDKLRGMLGTALKDPKVLDVLTKASFTAVDPDTAKLNDTIEHEYKLWSEVIAEKKIQLQ
ncbi:MAG: tripartite tricarboxylate transporter substrate binding protein [Candidimonas sp.]|nr:tripartite tricarboxylate transporter substrate binding protein [Candidimonas sp.]